MTQRRRFALLKQPFELDSLGDVNIGSPAAGQVLEFNGSQWVNVEVANLADLSEAIDDRVATLIVAGNNIDVTYDDGSNTFTIDVEALTTADITDLASYTGLDARYYTETELDAGQLDTRYYTETELGAGALDGRYYTESEVDTALSGKVGTGTTITAGVGLSGGGDLSANRTLDLDITELTAEATIDGAADYVVVYDATATAHRKVLINNLPGGSSSPLTTKGDIYTYDTADARLPVGTDGYVLTADSAQTLGIKWAAAGSGSSPTTTLGDIIRRGASADERLAIGSSGQVLTVVSGEPAWATASGGSTTITKVKATTEEKLSDTTVADDAELYADLVAGSYAFEAMLFTILKAAPDMRLGIGYSGTTTATRWQMEQFNANVSTTTTGQTSVWEESITYRVVTTSSQLQTQFRIVGSIIVSDSGRFAIQWAQNTSNSSFAATVKACSNLVIRAQ